MVEDPRVLRIVYVMHGIRDWASWSDHIRSELKTVLAPRERDRVAVVAAKYGYFAMMPRDPRIALLGVG
jgi:hypothetical protein